MLRNLFIFKDKTNELAEVCITLHIYVRYVYSKDKQEHNANNKNSQSG